jgi:hypothetical protein
LSFGRIAVHNALEDSADLRVVFGRLQLTPDRGKPERRASPSMFAFASHVIDLCGYLQCGTKCVVDIGSAVKGKPLMDVGLDL